MEQIEKEKCNRLKELVAFMQSNHLIREKSEVAEKSGIAVTSFNNLMFGSTKLTDSVLNKLTYAFPYINREWIVTGEGTMLLEDAAAKPISKSNIDLCIESMESQLKAIQIQINQLKQLLKE